MQQTDLKPIYISYFYSVFTCSGSWILEFFLVHSFTESCNFEKCCMVAQPKAVEFGGFVLYIFISVPEYVILAAKQC